MKRIIDGVTYNTATSTHLASSEYQANYNHDRKLCQGELYQTRGGAFFVHETVDLGFDRETEENEYRHRFEALSSDAAHQWIMTGDVEIRHNPFDEPPEVVAEPETSSTLYIRVPLSLKQRVDKIAKADGVSANSWAMKCVENCLARRV